MADGDAGPDYDLKTGDVNHIKIICLGDSAVGKSKLVERFLMKNYNTEGLSTFALTRFQYETNIDGKKVIVDFWDTAGQERFQTVHPSYYYQAHACILVFDCQRKVTYDNLKNWYKELREFRPEIPCVCVANKIDADIEKTKKQFKFPEKHKMPFYCCSAADGTNVVRLFKDAIRAAVTYKETAVDITDQILMELDYHD